MSNADRTGSERENPLCPDFSSHYENAFDLMFPAGLPDGRKPFQITSDEDDAIGEAAKVEYLNCEGHEPSGELAMSYSIKLDTDAVNALLWIADRYTSAEVLWDGSEYDEETETLTVPEHVAWEYAEALKEDNGNPNQMVPPCAGGPLADALIEFLGQIV